MTDPSRAGQLPLEPVEAQHCIDDSGSKLEIPGRSRAAILAELESAWSPVEPTDVAPIPYRENPESPHFTHLYRFTTQRFQENRIGHVLVPGLRELLDALANRLFALKVSFVVIQPPDAGLAVADSPATAAGSAFGDVRRVDLVGELRQRLPDVRVEACSELTVPEIARADVGIFPCEAALARTGTLVVAGRTQSELAVSLLPRISLGWMAGERLLLDSFAWAGSGQLDPTLNYIHISGPSRTADIEKQVVHGVHGPWQVTLFVIRPNEG